MKKKKKNCCVWLELEISYVVEEMYFIENGLNLKTINGECIWKFKKV